MHCKSIGSAQGVSAVVEAEILFHLYPLVFQQFEGCEGSVHQLACNLHIGKAGMDMVDRGAVAFLIRADEYRIGCRRPCQVIRELTGRPFVIGEDSIVAAEEYLGRTVIPSDSGGHYYDLGKLYGLALCIGACVVYDVFPISPVSTGMPSFYRHGSAKKEILGFQGGIQGIQINLIELSPCGIRPVVCIIRKSARSHKFRVHYCISPRGIKQFGALTLATGQKQARRRYETQCTSFHPSIAIRSLTFSTSSGLPLFTRNTDIVVVPASVSSTARSSTWYM